MNLIRSIDGFVVVLFGLIYGYKATLLERGVTHYQRLNASFFPLIIAGLILIIGIMMILKQVGADHSKIWPQKIFWKKIILFLIFLFGYAFVFDFVGFMLSTSLMIFYTSMLMGGKWYQSILVAVTTCLIIQILFNFILEINLPLGVLWKD